MAPESDQQRGEIPVNELIPVYGVQMDEATRCRHYHQEIDIIAIRHYCCGQYYPCHLCHEQLAGHPVAVWPAACFDQIAVLCGVCRTGLSINHYLAVDACPQCQAGFNPGCKLHRELYFSAAVPPKN